MSSNCAGVMAVAAMAGVVEFSLRLNFESRVVKLV